MKKSLLAHLFSVLLISGIAFGQSSTPSSTELQKQQEPTQTDTKNSDKKKSDNPEDQDNPVEKGVAKGSKATAKGAVYTGQAAADGSKQAAKGVTKGAKWVARPWGKKDKKTVQPSTAPATSDQKKADDSKAKN